MYTRDFNLTGAMLSKAVLKYINSLQIKKYRTLHQAFVVEGAKSVGEVLQSDLEVEKLFATAEFLDKLPHISDNRFEYHVVTEQDLVRAGTYESNNAALAIVKMKQLPVLNVLPDELIIALDDIRDPGNLGTIIRIADWYGISKIICSENCADFYNPKVISATMGSFTRVNAWYLNLPLFLKQLPKPHNVYGAALNGGNIHELSLKPKGIIIMGNEAKGISIEVMQHVNNIVKIPGFGKAESLNVATATAIIVDNFFRNE